eukprot:c33605_g1_i1 orf=2-172(-)
MQGFRFSIVSEEGYAEKVACHCGLAFLCDLPLSDELDCPPSRSLCQTNLICHALSRI